MNQKRKVKKWLRINDQKEKCLMIEAKGDGYWIWRQLDIDPLRN